MKFFKFSKFSSKKIPSKDFTKEDLPDTRWGLLWDNIKHNIWKIVPLNALYVVFLLPTIVLSGMLLFYLMGMAQKDAFFPRYIPYIADPTVVVPLGDGFFTMGASAFDVIWTYILLFAVVSLIAGPAKAGLYYVIRNISWGEYSFTYSDFWKGFKNNWKQGIFFNLLTGIIYICAYQGIFFYGNKYYTTNNTLYLYATWLVLLVVLFYNMMKIFFFPQLVTYTLTIRKIIKNSFIFSTIQLIRTLPLALVPALIFLIGIPFGQTFLGVMIFVLVGFAAVALFNMSFSNYIFDRYLNDRIPGAVMRRGMSPEKPVGNKRKRFGIF